MIVKTDATNLVIEGAQPEKLKSDADMTVVIEPIHHSHAQAAKQ